MYPPPLYSALHSDLLDTLWTQDNQIKVIDCTTSELHPCALDSSVPICHCFFLRFHLSFSMSALQ